MAVLTIEYRDEAERLGLEQAIRLLYADATDRAECPGWHGAGGL